MCFECSQRKRRPPEIPEIDTKRLGQKTINAPSEHVPRGGSRVHPLCRNRGRALQPGDEVHVSPCAPRTIRCGGCKRLHWERAKALFLERETRALRRRRRGGKSRQGAAAAELPVRRADSRSPRREPAAAQQSRSLSPGRRASNAGRSRALAARLGVGRFSPASRRVGRRRSGSHESAAGKEGRCGRRAEETQHAARNNTGSREGHLRGGQRAQNSAHH